MRCRLLFFLLILCNTIFAQRYEEDLPRLPREFLVSAGLTLGMPTGDFRQNLPNDALGTNFSILIKIKETLPVYVGVEFNGMNYDRANIRYLDQLDGYLVEVEEETKPSIYLGHAVIHIEPAFNFYFKPYMEGFVGFKNLATRTKLRDLELGEDAVLSNYLEEGDWAFSCGIALGARTPIFWEQLSINLKCSYLIGNAAYYLVRRPEVIGTPNRPIDVFEAKNSATNMLLPTIGLSYSFTY